MLGDSTGHSSRPLPSFARRPLSAARFSRLHHPPSALSPHSLRLPASWITDHLVGKKCSSDLALHLLHPAFRHDC
eukprot:759640-Hanusia_phi.AAC.3